MEERAEAEPLVLPQIVDDRLLEWKLFPQILSNKNLAAAHRQEGGAEEPQSKEVIRTRSIQAVFQTSYYILHAKVVVVMQYLLPTTSTCGI